MRKQWKGFLAGILMATMAFGFSSPAMAALAGKTIEVFTGVNVYVDDQLIQPQDANGNPVEVFVYNGTTYLPIRAVGEALGLPVLWEGKTQSAYVGKHQGDKPNVWIKDLDYFTGEKWYIYDKGKDNVGKEHSDAVAGNMENTYLINGQYSAVSGTLFQREEHKSDNRSSTLKIYGDGKLLYDAEVGGGIQPIDFRVDITGVLELKISFDDRYYDCILCSSHTNYGAAIADFGLWT